MISSHGVEMNSMEFIPKGGPASGEINESQRSGGPQAETSTTPRTAVDSRPWASGQREQVTRTFSGALLIRLVLEADLHFGLEDLRETPGADPRSR